MNLSGVVIARTRAGLFAVAKWSRIPALGRFVAGRFGQTWVGHSEAEAFDLAARSAYRGGMSVEGDGGQSRTVATTEGPELPAGAAPAPIPAFVLAPPRVSAVDAPETDVPETTPATPAWMPASAVALAELDGSDGDTAVRPDLTPRPGPGQRRMAGDTAPAFLLRTPSNVAPIADEFFDGLVGAVEGDR